MRVSEAAGAATILLAIVFLAYLLYRLAIAIAEVMEFNR